MVANIGITGEWVVKVTDPPITGDEVNDAEGRIVFSGFIDTQQRGHRDNVGVRLSFDDVKTSLSMVVKQSIDLEFGNGYSRSAVRAIEVWNSPYERHRTCLSNSSPEFYVGGLGQGVVNIFCLPRGKSEDYWALTGWATGLLDVEGISILFPQHRVDTVQSPATV